MQVLKHWLRVERKLKLFTPFLHLADAFMQRELQDRCTFSLACLHTGNKTTGDPLIK